MTQTTAPAAPPAGDPPPRRAPSAPDLAADPDRRRRPAGRRTRRGHDLPVHHRPQRDVQPHPRRRPAQRRPVRRSGRGPADQGAAGDRHLELRAARIGQPRSGELGRRAQRHDHGRAPEQEAEPGLRRVLPSGHVRRDPRLRQEQDQRRVLLRWGSAHRADPGEADRHPDGPRRPGRLRGLHRPDRRPARGHRRSTTTRSPPTVTTTPRARSRSPASRPCGSSGSASSCPTATSTGPRTSAT